MRYRIAPCLLTLLALSVTACQRPSASNAIVAASAPHVAAFAPLMSLADARVAVHAARDSLRCTSVRSVARQKCYALIPLAPWTGTSSLLMIQTAGLEATAPVNIVVVIWALPDSVPFGAARTDLRNALRAWGQAHGFRVNVDSMEHLGIAGTDIIEVHQYARASWLLNPELWRVQIRPSSPMTGSASAQGIRMDIYPGNSNPVLSQAEALDPVPPPAPVPADTLLLGARS